MLRQMNNTTVTDWKKNENIKGKLEETTTGGKLTHLIWFVSIQKGSIDVEVRNSNGLEMIGTSKRNGSPKKLG